MMDSVITWAGIPRPPNVVFSVVGTWSRNTVAAAIQGSDIVIAVVSTEYVASKECGVEIELAALHGKRIIPIVYDLQSRSNWSVTPPIFH